MNKTQVPTQDKKSIIVRIPPATYEKIVMKVIKQKKISARYSMNEYVSDLIEKDLK